MIPRITSRENDPTESRDGRARRSIRMRVKPSRNVLPESFLSIYFAHLLPIRFFCLARCIRHFNENSNDRFTRLAIARGCWSFGRACKSVSRVPFCVRSSRISNTSRDKQRVSRQEEDFQISRRQEKVPFHSNLALKHRLSEISSEIVWKCKLLAA